MKKTSLVVFNLTLAGFLEIETSAAQEAIPGTNDHPRARASPHDSRFRLGVEQTVGSFTHHSYVDASDGVFGWGFGALDLAADFRAIDRLEVGLGVGLGGTHVTYHASNDDHGPVEGSSTDSTLRIGPRLGYGIPLASSLLLVPRAGVEYMHSTLHSALAGSGGAAEQGYTTGSLAFNSGLFLEYRPVSWLFVGHWPTSTTGCTPMNTVTPRGFPSSGLRVGGSTGGSRPGHGSERRAEAHS